jgi:hypothetical protein
VAELSRQKDFAKQNDLPFDPNIQTGLEAKAAAQRKDVERVAAAWNAAVRTFSQAQLRKPQEPVPQTTGQHLMTMGGMGMGGM